MRSSALLEMREAGWCDPDHLAAVFPHYRDQSAIGSSLLTVDCELWTALLEAGGGRPAHAANAVGYAGEHVIRSGERATVAAVDGVEREIILRAGLVFVAGDFEGGIDE